MKVLSVAEHVRHIGVSVITTALVANQYEWDAWVGFTYVIGAVVYLIGYIMNEDFEF